MSPRRAPTRTPAQAAKAARPTTVAAAANSKQVRYYKCYRALQKSILLERSQCKSHEDYEILMLNLRGNVEKVSSASKERLHPNTFSLMFNGLVEMMPFGVDHHTVFPFATQLRAMLLDSHSEKPNRTLNMICIHSSSASLWATLSFSFVVRSCEVGYLLLTHSTR